MDAARHPLSSLPSSPLETHKQTELLWLLHEGYVFVRFTRTQDTLDLLLLPFCGGTKLICTTSCEGRVEPAISFDPTPSGPLQLRRSAVSRGRH